MQKDDLMRAKVFSLLLGASMLGTLPGCGTHDLFSYPDQVRGNKVDPDVLAQLVVGTSTKQDVTALLGSPTIKAAFDDNQWIYISEVTHPVIAGTQGVDDQHAFVVSFDQKGVLAGIEKRTMADSQPVTVVSRTTPSPGTEASFMQQLLGNVGRFGTAPALGQAQQGQQGTSTNPGNF
jgi:outer membrane protein assembly factor BamE (lipoprotein component of BamABCDE complex)